MSYKELKSVEYHYTDGTSVVREPNPTPLEVLKQMEEEHWTEQDLYEYMQKHFSKYDSWLSVAFAHLMDLGLEDIEANEKLEQWCIEWSLPF